MTARGFLVLLELPEGMDGEATRRALERLAREARDVGFRPKESFLSRESRMLVTYCEAARREDIVGAHLRAGLPAPRVHEADRIHTELLSEPHRAR